MGGGGVLLFQELNWAQRSHCIAGAKCGLIASNEREVQSFLRLQRLLARSLPRRRSRRVACVHIYILHVCVYICVCVYVCGHAYMYIYACVNVLVHLCVYTHVYVYVYAMMMIAFIITLGEIM